MIYFIRHGESQANAEGVIAGLSDSPLTEKGKRDAKVAAEALQKEGMVFDIIITSPMMRAYDTAKIVARAVGYPVKDIIVIEELKEKGSGEFEGKSPVLARAADAETIIRAGVESFEDFAARVERTDKEVARRAHGTTLVVGHSAFYRMAQCVKDHAPPSEMMHMKKPPNASLLKYPL